MGWLLLLCTEKGKASSDGNVRIVYDTGWTLLSTRFLMLIKCVHAARQPFVSPPLLLLLHCKVGEKHLFAARQPRMFCSLSNYIDLEVSYVWPIELNFCFFHSVLRLALNCRKTFQHWSCCWFMFFCSCQNVIVIINCCLRKFGQKTSFARARQMFHAMKSAHPIYGK